MKNKKINYNYSEEFKTSKNNPSEEELKALFNMKYFNYIKKKEKRILGGCNFG